MTWTRRTNEPLVEGVIIRLAGKTGAIKGNSDASSYFGEGTKFYQVQWDCKKPVLSQAFIIPLEEFPELYIWNDAVQLNGLSQAETIVALADLKRKEDEKRRAILMEVRKHLELERGEVNEHGKGYNAAIRFAYSVLDSMIGE